jgi:PAS domain-containing protein
LSRADAPSVACFPTSDAAFAAAVEALLALEEPATPTDLQTALRRVYPGAFVRRRALTSRHVEQWDAFRDAMFVPPANGDWDRAPDVAWLRLDSATGRILDANDALAALIASPRDGLIGQYAHDFVLPQTQPVSDAQLRAIAEAAETRSYGLARTSDGRTVLLEYIAIPAGDEVQVWLRDLGDPPEGE